MWLRNASIKMVFALPFSSLAVFADGNIGNLDWLAGHWCLQSGSQKIEEIWLPAGDDMIMGMGRTVENGKTQSFEFFRIAYRDQVLSYLAQPQGQSETVFKRVAGDEQWLRFENQANDFPTRIEYRRTGDKLLASIAGPGEDGEEKVISFDYAACTK